MSDVKQVIVVRYKYTNEKGETFSLRKGKMIAQACHASMAFMSKLIENKHSPTTVQQDWLDSSYAKICVRVDSEEQLMDVYKKAQDAGLEVHLITDSGRTEFHGVPTKTCLAIGPDRSEKIDLITKELKLL